MKCKAKTKEGIPCQMAAQKGERYCFTHSPSSGAKRAKAHSIGGHHRRIGHAGDVSALPANIRSVDDVMLLLDYTLKETLPQENGINRARVLISLSAAYLSALSVGELEKRIEILEGLQSPSSVFRHKVQA